LKRLFLVAGEASGDAHGAALIRALRGVAPEIVCEGLGGSAMAEAGMTLHHDLASEAIMGFAEVVKHFPRIRRLFLDTVAGFKRDAPDALVLIDYPGFNIRLAEAAHRLGIPVIYYISPQVWAWKKGRIKTIARCVRKMLVIFPFEEGLYRDAGLDCVYVGHPLADHVEQYTPTQTWPGKTVVGLLPGSRRQEIARLTGPMAEVARGLLKVHPDLHFVTPVVSEARGAEVRRLAGDLPLEIVVGGMYDVLASARCAMVASGTATLETALFGVPFVIMYKVQPVTYLIAKQVVQVPYIGMVNILAEREVAPEFIQGAATAKRVLPVMETLLAESPERAAMVSALSEVRAGLGAGGVADRAAAEILQVLHS